MEICLDTDIKSEYEIDLDTTAAKTSAPTRRTLRSSQESQDNVVIGTGGDEEGSVMLYKACVAVEEQLRLAESTVGQIDNFLTEEEEGWVACPTYEQEEAMASYFLKLRGDMKGWGTLVTNRGDESLQRRSVTKKSRGEDDSVMMKTYVQPRAPRGVPLLISPVGQTHDRYIGSVLGAGRVHDPVPQTGTQTLYRAEDLALPHELIACENDTIERCALVSLIRNAQVISGIPNLSYHDPSLILLFPYFFILIHFFLSWLSPSSSFVFGLFISHILPIFSPS